jgi:uncharacterized protein with GYD domain
MPLFVLLTKLTGTCKEKLRDEPEILEEICSKIKSCDQGSLPQLATLGQYNFINIIELEKENMIYGITLELNSIEGIETVILPALPINEYLSEVKKMKENK